MIKKEFVSSPGALQADSSLVDVLRWRAHHQADQQAYTFLADGELQESSLSYAELDLRARAIGKTLQRFQISGKRVLLLYPSGLDYITAFFGCLYTGAVAVPAYPPRSNRSLTRIQSIVNDSQATVILTNAQILAQAQRWFAHVPSLALLQWIATDDIADAAGETWQEPPRDEEALAFLQYTSGSTAAPKGVMISQKNMLHNLQDIQELIRSPVPHVGVSWLPIFHDMGLIACVLQATYAGFPMVLMAPTAFLQRPLRWLQAISRYGATFSCAPNFAYELCVSRKTPEDLAELDLSTWQYAISGAEPIRAATLRRFAEAFQGCGFQEEAFAPSYGLAEGTLLVTSNTRMPPAAKVFDASALKLHRVVELPESAQNETQTLVGNGFPAQTSGQTMVIVNPDTLTRCPADEVGEIWLAGESIAQGYWNNPTETEKTFGAFLPETGEGPFLRTGDLGFLLEGNLFITGRLKDLIILRGQNYYPQDIELTVAQSHPALRPESGAAFTIEVVEEHGFGLAMGSEERLVVVQEVLRHQNETKDIIAAIRQAIAEMYEIEVYAIVLVKYGSILKTSSGKIQRRACREYFLAGEFAVIDSDILLNSATTSTLPQSGKRFSSALLHAVGREEAYELLEGYFLEHISQLLGVETQELHAQQTLGYFGLDSLKMAQLKNCIDVDFEIDLPISSFFLDSELSVLIAETLDLIHQGSGLPKGPALIRREQQTLDEPLSFNQEQLWFLDQLQPGSSLYTIPVAFLLQGELDVSALERGIQTLVQRHEMLRAIFARVDDLPVQRIMPLRADPLPLIDLRERDAEEREQAALQLVMQEVHRPFDLSRGPLFRVQVLRLEEQKHVLLLTMHHSISDEWSLAVFFQELRLCYAGEEAALPPLPVRYTDYVHWQRQMQYTEEMAEHLAYWQAQLQGLEALELPLDHARPAIQTYQGQQYTFALPAGLTEKLKALSRERGVTLYMTLLASFQVLLARYSGQQDIVVGTPIAQRGKTAFENMIGYFVNMLALRVHLNATLRFDEVLERVRETCVDAYTHQDLPFLKLVEELQPARDASRNPLFQVFFTMQADALKRFDFPGLSVQPWELASTTAKFDLNWSIGENEQGLVGYITYNTDLFAATTIAQMASHWEILLQGIVANPEQAVYELPLLKEREARQILQEQNATTHPYAVEQCLHELFAAQARRTPDSLALVYEDQHLTYGELDRRVHLLASHLAQMLQPGTPVGICLERSPDMALGLLAILKCGGVAVPLDPIQPPERLAFILGETRLSVVVTHTALLAGFPAETHQLHFVCLDQDWEQPGSASTSTPGRTCSSAFPAYIIYTSGSTGTPKGVMNTHRALHNRLAWMLEAVSFTAADRVAQKTALSFDASLWEFFVPWMVGACLVMARPGGHQDSVYLCSLLQEEAITVLQLVPSMLRTLVQEPAFATNETLRHLFCGGEALSLETLRRFYALSSAQLHNLYGPTEASIDATYWFCEPEWIERVPIGRPIANMEIYILDAQMQPLPNGCIGEIYLGGSGLALGYIQRSDLTAERFLPHPFSQQAGARLYRTGDKARYRPDGLIEYLGRNDHQTKLRGYRIELGEIEAVLHRYKDIKQSVVVVHQTGQGEPHLVAYVVAHPEATLVLNELRQYLLAHLPFYMLPGHILPVSAFPYLNNGKLDYQALPAPPEASQDTLQGQAAEDISGYSPTETMLCELCASYLQVAQVSRSANFFELGGHSLLATRVINRIRDAYTIEVPLPLLFASATIAEFGRLIDTIVLAQDSALPSEELREEGIL